MVYSVGVAPEIVIVLVLNAGFTFGHGLDSNLK